MPRADGRLSVLFLCTGNSCRSQMAEGFSRALCSGLLIPHSAGTVAKGLDPRTVAMMAEAGVDISAQRSKSLDDLRNPQTGALPEFDCVITVCDAAQEACPRFPGAARVLHAGFDDPPVLARTAQSEPEALSHYRRVRDEIRAFVERLPEMIGLSEATTEDQKQDKG
jgi:arsenate reductase (thioredoxin)